MKRRSKPLSMSNDIHSKMILSQESMISLFEKKSKKTLLKKVSSEELNNVFDDFISNIFYNDNLAWLNGFSDKFRKIFKKNTNLKEAYMQFMSAYMQSLTAAINSQPSKIDSVELERFYEKIDDVTTALIYQKDIARDKAFGEEAEHLNRLATLGRLSAIVAHEIRNPLSGIALSASLLKKKLKEDWKYIDSIENILEGIEKIESVILRLLDFSKPKETRRRKVSILDPMREALFFIRSRAKKESIVIYEDYSESLPFSFTDPDQITQVLINLLLNAIQAIGSDGTISISISVDPRSSIILKIADTGSGIKEEDIPRIFDPFFTTKTDGTGLGLTISKNILIQNEIGISVDSMPGKGTTFTLKIKAHHEI
jgi:signal transduction histidine kinase